MKVTVYIAVSIDGYIARENGDLDWLEKFNNSGGDDYGYDDFIKGVDAVVIGRNTYEKILSFNEWPYTKKVFILSSKLGYLPDILTGKASLLSMPPKEIIWKLSEDGFSNIYLDGGKAIQNFLSEDLIDELIITRIPVLIGSGIPLFGYLKKDMFLKHTSTKIYSNGFVKSSYSRI